MNYNFSIESSIEKIQNIGTREYFNEVYQTFVNGNYRSSTVMLYSVLICDLVYKLRDLRDVYQDKSADSILLEIEKLQKSNPKSPDWESKLIDMIESRTTLLEPSDIINIKCLQNYRHLSAHPVLTNADLLFSPNKETVQSLIRNVLEGVLINPPFFSNKIFDSFVNDLSEVKDKILEAESLENYLNSRYLKRLKENDLKKIFRSLWKIIFIATDQNSTDNLVINFKALRIIVQNNKSLYLNLIKNEPSFYSNFNKSEKLNLIIFLLLRLPELFKLLEPALQTLLRGHIKKTPQLKFISWFTKDSLKEHFIKLDFRKDVEIKSDHLKEMRKLAAENNCEHEMIMFVLNYFGQSGNYVETKDRFTNSIEPIIDELKLEHVKRLLELANANDQIYGKVGMKSSLKNIAEKYSSDVNKEEYPKVFPKK